MSTFIEALGFIGKEKLAFAPSRKLARLLQHARAPMHLRRGLE
jgi:hypothetical protein